MAAFALLKLSLLFTLLSLSNARLGLWPKTGQYSAFYPPTCSRIECPSYDVIHVGDGYEIRRYNSMVWISTSTINNVSFVEANKLGFLQLFNYIEGNNEKSQTIEMTAPVITQVTSGDEAVCSPSYTVSFYIPKANQEDPPTAKGLNVQKSGTTYAAVRQFSGFVSNTDVVEQSGALLLSLKGSDWLDAIKESKNSIFSVAQYNSPFELQNRVNEIWITFEKEDEDAM